MKTHSAKAKGRRLQNEVRDILLREWSSVLHPDDVRVAIMGESGTDIKLSPAARRYIPYAIECKNQEHLNIWDALQQAAENAADGATPALIFRRNRSNTYVALPLDAFLALFPKPPSTNPS